MYCLSNPSRNNFKRSRGKKPCELTPFVFGGLSGERSNSKFGYGKPTGDVGLSGLFDLNSVTSLEFALNPDFLRLKQTSPKLMQILLLHSFS